MSAPTPVFSGKKRKRAERAFVFDSYPSRKVALRLAYHGHVHDGLAKQEETSNTVEGIVCDALKRVRLVPESGPQKFGRCGRTDKGVSALGNCFSLVARASCNVGDVPQQPPLDYCHVLNGVLPPTIRMVGFALVEDDFDARFSCTSRTYRYYFCHRGLNVEAMRAAAQEFLGTHNFRNFCRMDVVNVSNFQRTVHEVGIYPSEQLPELISYFEISANSFLYHQIRCTMEVLFLIGRGLEEPSVVRELLERGDCKPVYPLADGGPLILWDCGFDGLRWTISRRALHAVEREMDDICTSLLIRSTSTHAMRAQVKRWYEGEEAVADEGDRDGWAITGCDWTEPHTHDKLKVRKYSINTLARSSAAEGVSSAGNGSNASSSGTDLLVCDGSPASTSRRACAVSSTTFRWARPPNYVALLDRETERTFEEEVQALSAAKKSRYELNAQKKAAASSLTEVLPPTTPAPH